MKDDKKNSEKANEKLSENSGIKKPEPEDKKIQCEAVDETGVIFAGTKIEGNIETGGNLVIGGTVEGSVTAKGNVTISGNVKGAIKCRDLTLENCNLKAEIQATGDVAIKHGTVSGNILCKNLSVAGTVNGNIDAGGVVALLEGAEVRGDIKAASIGMNFGAFMDGRITMTGPKGK